MEGRQPMYYQPEPGQITREQLLEDWSGNLAPLTRRYTVHFISNTGDELVWAEIPTRSGYTHTNPIWVNGNYYMVSEDNGGPSEPISESDIKDYVLIEFSHRMYYTKIKGYVIEVTKEIKEYFGTKLFCSSWETMDVEIGDQFRFNPDLTHVTHVPHQKFNPTSKNFPSCEYKVDENDE